MSIDWPVQSSAVGQVDGPMRVMLTLVTTRKAVWGSILLALGLAVTAAA
jgi:hypothetical protein